MRYPRLFSVVCLYFLSTFFLEGLLTAGSQNLIRYRVKRGEYLEKIAKRFGVRVSALRRWNRLRNADTIYAGQTLKIFLPKTNVGIASPPPRFCKPARFFRILKGFDRYGDIRHYGILAKTDARGLVLSAAAGRVIQVSYRPRRGQYILVDHGGGWLSMYSHLQKIYVRKGEKIKQAQVIGKSVGRKLFFLIAKNGVPVNPARYL